MRGIVCGYSESTCTFSLEYQDGSVEEHVNLDTLNERLETQFHSCQSLVAGHCIVRYERIGGEGLKEYDRLVEGITPNWDKGRVKYDPRHFMSNWVAMVSAAKDSPLFKMFMRMTSEAIFKMLPGEYKRVRAHLIAEGLSEEAVKKVPWKYWRRRCRYTCPEPERIIRGLLDVFNFFKDLDDPLRPGHKFMASGAAGIFEKEIAYVQKGFLSDFPGMEMYRVVGKNKRTGLVVYRCLRTSSALEGYHHHLRLALSTLAKGCGLATETARCMIFDFVGA